MRRVLSLIFGLLAVVVGCAPPISSGEVLDRQFVPAHVEPSVEYDPLTESIVPSSDDVPDKWYIRIGKKDEDGQWKERVVEVSETTYLEFKKGDWFQLETQ